MEMCKCDVSQYVLFHLFTAHFKEDESKANECGVSSQLRHCKGICIYETPSSSKNCVTAVQEN